jgi:hypothetical protein
LHEHAYHYTLFKECQLFLSKIMVFREGLSQEFPNKGDAGSSRENLPVIDSQIRGGIRILAGRWDYRHFFEIIFWRRGQPNFQPTSYSNTALTLFLTRKISGVTLP